MKYLPNEDIFETGAGVIVNPVNCQVHKLADRRKPQRGLAGAFEKRFPSIQPALIKACRDGNMKPGSVQLLGVSRATGERVPRAEADLLIANVATKDYWGAPSKIEWIAKGLKTLSSLVEAHDLGSIAIPMLGAGYGGLAWDDVRNLVETHFRPLSGRGVDMIVLGEGPVKKIARDVEAAEEGSGDVSLSMRRHYAGIGARETPASVLKTMEEVGAMLARNGFILRSGGADGADSAFERGADTVDPSLKEIFLPREGFDPLRDGNKRYSNGTTVFADKASPTHVALARKHHPAFDRLGAFAKDLQARNGSQVLGRELDVPSDVIVCWTVGGKVKGGTGQALRVAADHGIGVVNLGDPRLETMPARSIASIAVDVAEGADVEASILAEMEKIGADAPRDSRQESLDI